MNKNNIILWVGALIITFLTVYLSNLFSSDYPITGTFGIEGKKVSYRLERTHYGKDDVNILIRTDINDLSGSLKWENNGDSVFNSVKMQPGKLILTGMFPALNPEQKLDYYVDLNYKDKIYHIPFDKKVNLVFYGKIPTPLNILEFILLYSIIILSVRTGLEWFNENKYTKKFGVVNLILLLTLIALINPLYLTYKYGFMNHIIPPIGRLFYWSDIITSFLWIGTIIFIFNSNKVKFMPIISAVITIVLFVFFR